MHQRCVGILSITDFGQKQSTAVMGHKHATALQYKSLIVQHSCPKSMADNPSRNKHIAGWVQTIKVVFGNSWLKCAVLLSIVNRGFACLESCRINPNGFSNEQSKSNQHCAHSRGGASPLQFCCYPEYIKQLSCYQTVLRAP